MKSFDANKFEKRLRRIGRNFGLPGQLRYVCKKARKCLNARHAEIIMLCEVESGQEPELLVFAYSTRSGVDFQQRETQFELDKSFAGYCLKNGSRFRRGYKIKRNINSQSDEISFQTVAQGGAHPYKTIIGFPIPPPFGSPDSESSHLVTHRAVLCLVHEEVGYFGRKDKEFVQAIDDVRELLKEFSNSARGYHRSVYNELLNVTLPQLTKIANSFRTDSSLEKPMQELDSLTTRIGQVLSADKLTIRLSNLSENRQGSLVHECKYKSSLKDLANLNTKPKRVSSSRKVSSRIRVSVKIGRHVPAKFLAYELRFLKAVCNQIAMHWRLGELRRVNTEGLFVPLLQASNGLRTWPEGPSDRSNSLSHDSSAHEQNERAASASRIAEDRLISNILVQIESAFSRPDAPVFISYNTKRYAELPDHGAEVELPIIQIRFAQYNGKRVNKDQRWHRAFIDELNSSYDGLVGYIAAKAIEANFNGTEQPQPVVCNSPVERADYKHVVYREPNELDDNIPRDGFQSSVTLPVYGGDLVLYGVLNVESPLTNAFTEHDVTLLQTFGNLISITHQRARHSQLAEDIRINLGLALQASDRTSGINDFLTALQNAVRGKESVQLAGIVGPVPVRRGYCLHYMSLVTDEASGDFFLVREGKPEVTDVAVKRAIFEEKYFSSQSGNTGRSVVWKKELLIRNCNDERHLSTIVRGKKKYGSEMSFPIYEDEFADLWDVSKVDLSKLDLKVHNPKSALANCFGVLLAEHLEPNGIAPNMISNFRMIAQAMRTIELHYKYARQMTEFELASHNSFGDLLEKGNIGEVFLDIKLYIEEVHSGTQEIRFNVKNVPAEQDENQEPADQEEKHKRERLLLRAERAAKFVSFAGYVLETNKSAMVQEVKDIVTSIFINETFSCSVIENVKSHVDKHIKLSKAQLTNILYTLIANAEKAQSSEATVNIDATDEVLVLRVSDSGKGLVPEALKAMSESFSGLTKIDRFDEDWTFDQGTHKALIRCGKLLRSTGGKLRPMNNSNGVGATFEVQVPYR